MTYWKKKRKILYENQNAVESRNEDQRKEHGNLIPNLADETNRKLGEVNYYINS